MNNKYKINYILISALLMVFSVLAIITVVFMWNESLAVGIILTVYMIGVVIFGIKQFFNPKNIKSVTVNTDSLIIEYRKRIIEVFFKDIKKIEHYKHGPLTEKTTIYAKAFKYEITYEIKDFREMCRNIYTELSKRHMENIADEWFQKKFGVGIN